MAAFGAAISEHPTAALAVGEVVGSVLEQVGEAPDVAIVFVSGHEPASLTDIADAIRTAFHVAANIEIKTQSFEQTQRPKKRHNFSRPTRNIDDQLTQTFHVAGSFGCRCREIRPVSDP